MPNLNLTTDNSIADPEKSLSGGAKFLDPESIVSSLDIRPRMEIADFGCGTGYFTFPLAKKVEKEGVVYALDILASKLENIKSQAKILRLGNIVTKKVNLEREEGSKLKKESVDWVILVNMLFQNNKEGRKNILREAKRVLKKGGFMLVIEWNSTNFSMGPDKSLRISKNEMTGLAHENGLGVVKEIAIEDFHYGLILAKYK